jgi:hypothetical protein
MKKLVQVGMAAVMTFAMTACGGGGGGGGSVSTGGVYFTHSELAREFVKRAYSDGGVSLTLVKGDTEHSGYVVVNSYYGLQAVYIDGWTVGNDIRAYMNSQSWYDVYDIGGGRYQDNNGFTYEESSVSNKDLSKMAAMKQAFDIDASAKGIQAQFGLSADRSQVLARLAVQLKNNPKASMTDADYDSYAKEIMGSSIGTLKAALAKQAQGDSTDVMALIDKAAQTNGVGPEQVTQILISMIPSGN